MSPSEIRQIFQPRRSNASRLLELAERANSLAATVEERWGELSEERRELLADFAYQAIDPPSDMGAKLHSFLNRCYGAWMILQGERDAFVAYASASDRLTNAIIRASERDSYKTMTAEEACEWIREISDRALGRFNLEEIEIF